ncbi:DNA-processing protein DprA [Aliikangiella maris]|uniref:DNA-processing protein DprA n=2 Tax=Aliikangiella maris TaxID=3162458 RepID=A0ABV3MK51_9GAMM
MINKIHKIDIHSSFYPKHLAKIMSPPQVLWSAGNLELLVNPGISIVGTRNASKAGLVIAKRLAAFVNSKGKATVSGLALGIDTAVHMGSVEIDSPTIAVLASGVDIITPRQNISLSRKILETGGLIVSEQPPGTLATKGNYVPRNRIQVGLSSSSIIVESSVRSGTMTHARFCFEERHPLFVVMPEEGNPLQLNFSGPELLVNELGAIPLYSKNDYKLLMSD